MLPDQYVPNTGGSGSPAQLLHPSLQLHHQKGAEISVEWKIKCLISIITTEPLLLLLAVPLLPSLSI